MHHETLAILERLVARSGDPSKKEILVLLKKAIGRIDQLDGQVESLVSVLNLDRTANVQAAFRLPEQLAQLLIMLSDGKPRNKESLHAALYFRRPDRDMPEVKIIDTLLSKLRKSIAPYGIEIGTVWGGACRLTAGEDVVMAAIESAQPSGAKVIDLAALR
ncbi:hypothetical protein NKJ71_19575 [Mesorhizobium sp. M0050]|uniref:hypothetical protein n=1 Tax=Mesorhizobium sp. M0050 TaxID=2956861 RepID=UPI00333B5325